MGDASGYGISKYKSRYMSDLSIIRLIYWCKIWGFHGGDYDDYHLLGHLPEDDNHQFIDGLNMYILESVFWIIQGK
jgi:hypothetical protein